MRASAFFQKGVNFTAEGPHGYEPARAVPMLDRLRAYGVNAIALVPYGFERRSEPDIHFGGGWERAEWIAAIAAAAHHRGMKVLLKPQIWIARGFPGDLDFPAPAARARWFQQYGRFLDFWADQAGRMQADLFAVGVEFARLTREESAWRALIARARERYRGPLVYAACHGPEFESIRFWDALDYIGLNEYYPLPQDLDTAGLVRRVARVPARFGKPLVFTEAGFSSFHAAYAAPWDETPRALAPAEQARCYEAVLRAFYGQPWFAGVYWWKIGSNGYGGPNDGSHTPWGKPAMEVLRKWYSENGDRLRNSH